MGHIIAGKLMPCLTSLLAMPPALDVGRRRPWPRLTAGAVALAAAVPLFLTVDGMIHP